MPIYDYINHLTNKFVARKTIYTLLLLVLCYLIDPVSIIWLIGGILFYYIIRPIQLATWHEYISHRQLMPRNKFIEILGLYILAVYEMSGPKYKFFYHDLHHRFLHTDLDPTHSKLVASSSFVQFCLDLQPSCIIHYDKAQETQYQNNLTKWFDYNHKKVWLISVVIWLLIFPLWTFTVFYLMPVFFWNFVNRAGEYIWHHPDWQIPDNNWLVFILSQNAWHQSHHDEDYKPDSERKLFYGPDIWKWFNIDFYIRKIFFVEFKE